MTIFILALCVTSCGGMRFGNTPLNLDLPQSFTKRMVWADSSVLQYQLDALAGHVIYEDTSQPGRYTRGPQLLLNDKSEIRVEPVKDGDLYDSKIDSGASAQASYLAFAAKLGEESTMEVVITDVALASIKDIDIPLHKLRALAKRPNTKRYWVQAALLTRVMHKVYTKVNADLSGVVGEVFGAKGNAYHAATGFTRDAVIGMLVIDIDKFLDEIELRSTWRPAASGHSVEPGVTLGVIAEVARVSKVVMSPLTVEK